MRLIDADVLMENAEYDEYYRLIVRAESIINTPTIDAQPVKHGRWMSPTLIGSRHFNVPHCSVCGEVPCGVDENTHYCPNCGAKMDGGK